MMFFLHLKTSSRTPAILGRLRDLARARDIVDAREILRPIGLRMTSK
jgi:hypothetical protein